VEKKTRRDAKMSICPWCKKEEATKEIKVSRGGVEKICDTCYYAHNLIYKSYDKNRSVEICLDDGGLR
jgi:hypothetical protein